jgi:hypothetical protein
MIAAKSFLNIEELTAIVGEDVMNQFADDLFGELISARVEAAKNAVKAWAEEVIKAEKVKAEAEKAEFEKALRAEKAKAEAEKAKAEAEKAEFEKALRAEKAKAEAEKAKADEAIKAMADKIKAILNSLPKGQG